MSAKDPYIRPTVLYAEGSHHINLLAIVLTQTCIIQNCKAMWKFEEATRQPYSLILLDFESAPSWNNWIRSNVFEGTRDAPNDVINQRETTLYDNCSSMKRKTWSLAIVVACDLIIVQDYKSMSVIDVMGIPKRQN